MNLKITHLVIVFITVLVILLKTGSTHAIGISITSYDLQTTLTTLNDNYLFVKLTCEMVKSDTALSYELLFNSGAKVSTISYQDGINKNISFHFKGTDTLLIQLPLEAKNTNSFKLLFNYAFPISMTDSSILMMDRGHRWYPLIADCIAGVKISADVPEGCEVLSTGNLVDKTSKNGMSTFVWESTMPVFKIPLIVFRSDIYKHSSIKIDDKEIVLYTLAQYDSDNDTILNQAGNVFKFCMDNLGEYPFKKLTIMEYPEFEGMNTGSGIVEIGSSNFDFMKRGYYDGLQLTIAQQWIGAGVFAKFGVPGFWFLSLSLPHYIKLMYIRQTAGEEAYNKNMQDQLDKYKQFAGKENDAAIMDVDYPNTKEKGLVLYAKGPYVFSLLHKQMGDERWFGFLKQLYADYLGKILTYNAFRETLSHFGDSATIPLLDKLVKEKGMPD